MVVKLLTLDILFPGASSLKEKRYVVSSLKNRLRQRFNVSVAEVDYHDRWQRCLLAVAVVAVDRRSADSMSSRVIRFVEGDHRATLADTTQEFR
jgi:uncharacterized protein YlxP (DUF503 family)